jgi:serine/threonine protein kinase
MTGGDLRFHIGKKKRFNEEQTSILGFIILEFMMACMIVGLEYMHNNGVVHRDIKPENLVMDQNGYVRITDLGIARIWTPENSQDTSGTPGYMGIQFTS